MTIDQTMKDEFFFFMNFVPKTIFGGMRNFQLEGSKESDLFDVSEAIAWSVNRQDPCLALKWTRELKNQYHRGCTKLLTVSTIFCTSEQFDKYIINQDEAMVL